jgi:hypothetical protein
MVMWTTRQEWVSETGWFADKVCMCEMSNLWHRGYDWSTMNQYKEPPTCGTCGLWANRLARCCKCNETYYQFFSHPRMGHHMVPIRGWYCWNCLEKFVPPVVESMAASRTPIPPPQIVLPPGYEIYVPKPINWG